MSHTSHSYAAAFALGMTCGARTFLGPALVGEAAPPVIGFLLRCLSVGEIVGDKLPQTPSRLMPAALAARAISGAVCGGILCARAGKSVVGGALLGAAGALLWSKVGHDARAFLGKKLAVPDFLIAWGEDALAVWTGRRAAFPQ